MSFKYKPKIVLKDLRFKELFELYNSYFDKKDLQHYFENSVEENRNCQLCDSLIPLGNQIYGIPIGLRQIDKELEVDVYGTYCSLYCSYIYHRNLKEDSIRRKCIKFLDSEQFYRCLFYKFFKKFTITSEDKEINLQEKCVRFRKIYNIDV